MINKNKRDKPIISECTCRGLNLLEKLSQYYIDRFQDVFSESLGGRIKQYEDAKKLSNGLFNILTDKGVKYSYDLPPVESFKRDNLVKNELDDCNSNYPRNCVTALEMLMGRLHQSFEAQNKLICGRNPMEGPPYLGQQDVDDFLSDILRGEFYKTKDPNYYELQYNPFEKYFDEEHIQACKKYKK